MLRLIRRRMKNFAKNKELSWPFILFLLFNLAIMRVIAPYIMHQIDVFFPALGVFSKPVKWIILMAIGFIIVLILHPILLGKSKGEGQDEDEDGTHD